MLTECIAIEMNSNLPHYIWMRSGSKWPYLLLALPCNLIIWICYPDTEIILIHIWVHYRAFDLWMLKKGVRCSSGLNDSGLINRRHLKTFKTKIQPYLMQTVCENNNFNSILLKIKWFKKSDTRDVTMPHCQSSAHSTPIWRVSCESRWSPLSKHTKTVCTMSK